LLAVHGSSSQLGPSSTAYPYPENSVSKNTHCLSQTFFQKAKTLLAQQEERRIEEERGKTSHLTWDKHMVDNSYWLHLIEN
jgi:hypothetical protein